MIYKPKSYIFFIIVFFVFNLAESQKLFEGGPDLFSLLYINPNDKKFDNSLEKEKVKKNIERWMVYYQKKGVNLFCIYLIDQEGNLLFDSKALKKVGFNSYKGSLFELILSLAKKYNLSLSLSIDDLGHIINGTLFYKESIEIEKIDLECISDFIDELGFYRKKYDVPLIISEESFVLKYAQVLSKSCRKNKIKYMRYFGDKKGISEIFCSEDYSTYPYAPDDNIEDSFYLYNISKWGSFSGRIGLLNMMFGRAKVLKKDTGILTSGGWGLIPGCQQNVALFRTVQFSPKIYCFISASYSQEPYNNKEDDKFVSKYNYKKLEKLIHKFSKKENKKIVNIVINFPNPPFNEEGNKIFYNILNSSIEMITNSITSAGYDIAVTYNEYIKNADMYYIFASGSSSHINLYSDISAEILDIFRSKKTIFLQSALGLPRGANWRKIAPLLGLPVESSSFTGAKNFTPIPKFVNYSFPTGNKKVRFRGFNFNIGKLEEAGKIFKYDHLSNISLKDIHPNGKILIVSKVGEKPIPILTKFQQRYFINGNLIHLDFSNILANIMTKEKPFQSPSFVYLSKGNKYSAIFSAKNNIIDIKFGKKGEIYHWKSDSEKYYKSPLVWKRNRLYGFLRRWELVIIQHSKIK